MGLLAEALRSSPPPSPQQQPPSRIQRQKAKQQLPRLAGSTEPTSPTSTIFVISDYFDGVAAPSTVSSLSSKPRQADEGLSARAVLEQRPSSAPMPISSRLPSSVCSVDNTERARCRNCSRRIFVPSGQHAHEGAQFCSGDCLWSFRLSAKISVPAPASRFIGLPPGY